MNITDVPARLNIRIQDQERQDVATIAAAITTPHRRHVTVTETIRAALSIAAETVAARNASPSVSQEGQRCH